MTGAVLARVLRVSGLEVLVVDEAGDRLLCQLRGRLKAGPRLAASPVVAGDQVDVRVTEAGRGVIEGVRPRRSWLSRTASGSRRVQQVLVANLDRFLIVVSARQPALRPGFIDRALVMALSGGVEPVICINKIDLDVDRERAPVAGLYVGLGYRVLETSALTGEGMGPLVDLLRGGLAALVGPSGAGKSSILNAVEPGLALKTQVLMRHHDRGRHTTSSICLHPLTGGGLVADTPGIKQLQPWAVAAEELVAYFPEMEALAESCQYRDCSHLREPGCAVRAAVEDGRIASSRYEGFCRIAADALAGVEAP